MAPFYTDRVVTVRIVMPGEDWESSQENAFAEEYVRADFWFGDKLVPDVAVRPKGYSSLMWARISSNPRVGLKVDFNFFNSARNFYGLKKVNFNNGYKDPTLIREVLSYGIFEQMGVPTPRTCFVDLWVNDTHLGVYTMVEQIDRTFLEEHFDDDTGNLYKPEMPAAYLGWTEADLNREQEVGEEEEDVAVAETPPGRGRNMQMGHRGDYLEEMELKTNENNPDHSALFRLLEVLNNEPDETFAGEVEKVLDVDQVLRFLAVSAAIVHLDNYIGMGHNYYLYEVDGKFSIIPWDLNMAFGTFKSGLDRDGLVNFYIDEPTAGDVARCPLVRLLSVPAYLDTYHGYMEELIGGPFSEGVMNSRIDELADLIRPYVEEDELKFYTTEQFETCLSRDWPTGKQTKMGMTAYGLKGFITERIESVREQLAGTRQSSSGDGSGNGGRYEVDDRDMGGGQVEGRRPDGQGR